MMSLQLVTDLNNLGVAYLEAGDLRHALEYFSDALKFTMGDLGPSTVEHQSQHQQPDDAESSYYQQQQVGPQLHHAVSAENGGGSAALPHRTSAASNGKSTQTNRLPPPPTTTAGVQHQQQQQQQHRPPPPRIIKPTHIERIPSKAQPTSIPFAYARGINLIPCPAAYSPDSLINTTIISSIIIFNLAMIYHLKGLEGVGAQSTMRLTKGKALYQKSHHLLVDAGVPLGSTGNPVIDMLSMALFNNMAHVSYEMAQYDESRRYFDHLIRFALTVVPARYGDAYVGNLLDQQKSNFLLNAIILQAPKLAPAA